MMPFVVCLLQGAGLLSGPAQEERPDRPGPGSFSGKSASRPLVDFEWLEVGPRLGVAIFSEDFDTDPTFCFSILGRAPMPWLSPSSKPQGEYFGLFAEVGFAALERELEPEPDDPDGTAVFLAAGVDFTFVRDGTWLLMAHAGPQYAYYGGVSGLNDGFSALVGLTAGVEIASGVTLTAGPEAAFGHAGDRVLFASFGVLIDF